MEEKEGWKPGYSCVTCDLRKDFHLEEMREWGE